MTLNTVFCRVIKRRIAESAQLTGGCAAALFAAAVILTLCGMIFAVTEVKPAEAFRSADTAAVCREADAGNGTTKSAALSPPVLTGKNLRRNLSAAWPRTGLSPCAVVPPGRFRLDLGKRLKFQNPTDELFAVTVFLCPRPPVRAGPLIFIPVPGAV